MKYQKYSRLVEIFVKPDLRDEIRELKRGRTYDEFLRILIKNEDRMPYNDPQYTKHAQPRKEMNAT